MLFVLLPRVMTTLNASYREIKSGPEANPSSWLISSEKLYVFMYDVPKRKFLQANYAEKIKEGEERWFNFTSGNIHDYFNSKILPTSISFNTHQVPLWSHCYNYPHPACGHIL